ncbi:MAG: GNAT family N-acetyltransferase [Propionibacteriales bacterium]|nr:GNAT family N-acetyltransferase [Propionibacteriales bacterium]
MDPVELSGGRLQLRLPREADVDEITRACQDPELQRWIPVPVPYQREHAVQWVGDTPGSWAENRELRWTILERLADGSSSGPVGVVGLHAHDETMREIGFWAAPWARGRGVMTDAVRLVCQWGFEELGLRRIEWWANVGNDASRRVAEKVGFTMEGTCRSRILHRGERVDGWVAGLLPGDLT